MILRALIAAFAVVGASPFLEHARLVEEGRAHLEAGRRTEAADVLGRALRLPYEQEVHAPIVDPATAWWVAAAAGPAEPPGLAGRSCVFVGPALALQRALAQGNAAAAQLAIDALERLAADCQVKEDDPRRSELLAYAAYAKFAQGDLRAAAALRKRALAIRQKSVAKDDLQSALWKAMSAAEADPGAAKKLRAEALVLAKPYGAGHAVVVALENR